MLRKIGIGPAMMVRSAPWSRSTLPVAQDAAQSHAHPAIQCGERGLIAVLEILKPAHQGSIQIDEGGLKALPVRAPGLGSDGVWKFPLTLRARPFAALLEMVTEKIETARLGGVHNPRLDRVQRQSGLRRPAPAELPLPCHTTPRSRPRTAPSRCPFPPSQHKEGRKIVVRRSGKYNENTTGKMFIAPSFLIVPLSLGRSQS